MAGTRAEGPVLRVAGDRAHNQARVALVQHVPTQTEALHHAGPVAFDEDVRGLQEEEEQLASLLRLQVQRDASLVSVDRLEQAALALHERRRPAHVVARAWLLNLDDVRPHFREEHRAEGAWQETGQVENSDPR